MATLAELTSDWWLEHRLAEIGAHVSRLEEAMLAAVQTNRKEAFEQMKEARAVCHYGISELLKAWESDEWSWLQ